MLNNGTMKIICFSGQIEKLEPEEYKQEVIKE